MQLLNNENKDVYVIGDFNINLLKLDSDGKVKDFVDFMYSYNMFALITKPTRITTTTASLIDIFSNCVQNELNSGIILFRYD